MTAIEVHKQRPEVSATQAAVAVIALPLTPGVQNHLCNVSSGFKLAVPL